MLRVVITDCDHPSIDIEERVFAAASIAVDLADCRSEDDVISAGLEADGLLVQYAPVTRHVLETLPRCRAVARYGTGLDTIDTAAAAERHVAVIPVPDYAVSEVSDHTVALILALERGVVAADRAVHRGEWTLESLPELRRAGSRSVGVLGLGRIGRTVAEKLAALGFLVVGYDPLIAPGTGRFAVTLERLLAESDVVTLHLPLTEGTRNLVNESLIGRMREGAYLVNTARGGLVDEASLIRALASGRLGGAALDVFASEPLCTDSPLLSSSNVILTPHVAFYSRESLQELKRRAAAGLVEALEAGRGLGADGNAALIS
jgi:D-3-phosphoglycerate dehydrogenase